MNKIELVNAVAEKSGLSKADAKKAVDGVLDAISGALVHIDKKTNRIRLSIRRLQKKKERQELNEYNSDEKITLGDVLKDRL